MDIMTFWVSRHIAHDVSPHTHDFFQLIYCESGKGRITIGTTTYHARPGHAYLSYPGIPHAIENEADLYILELKFFADESALENLHLLPEHIDIENLPSARELLVSTIEEGLSRPLHYNEAANACLKLFFIHVLRKYTKQPQTNQTTYNQSAILDVTDHAKDHHDVCILNLKYYINNHLPEPITLDDLAKEVHFSKAFFCKRFQILFGMPPMKYVTFMRISRAKHLLLETTLPISTIAVHTGFASPHYFSRCFKSWEGISPQRYRNHGTHS